jgi:hypothetical protein
MTCVCPVITLSPRDYDAAPFDHDGGIISQFEGYEKLRELDWEDYRTRYGNIQRLDLILEGENDSANRYRGHALDLRLTRGSLTVRGRDGAAAPISLCVDDKVHEFVSGTTRVFRLNGEARDDAIVQADQDD